MPADFIKNKTEMKLTGLELGCPLTNRAITSLYELGSPSRDLAYILHTEPSLSRSDGYGLACQVPLRWHTPEWVFSLIEMLIFIAHHLSLPPAVIEIHPGDKRNSINDIINAVRLILHRFNYEFAASPLILLENRTGQFLSSGQELASFAKLIAKEEDLKSTVGIVLDIQQLFTSTKSRFSNELNAIPRESIKGLHIHTKHRTPSISDPIPWKKVFSWVRQVAGNIIINPEVHHRKQVSETIRFCELMMKD